MTLASTGLLLALTLPASLRADPPVWWTQRGAVTPGASASDFAVVNQGQLKNMLRAVAGEMDAHLPQFEGAGPGLHAAINDWLVSQTAEDYAALNLGQLKNAAKLVYDRLIPIGYADQYPWTATGKPAGDFDLANAGQVKNLFNFDFTHSSDPSGLPDWWQRYFYGHTGVNPNQITDSPNGLTIGQTFGIGADPNLADEIPVAWKIDHGIDPRDPNLANRDSDGDGVTDAQEYKLHLDPHWKDNPAVKLQVQFTVIAQ